MRVEDKILEEGRQLADSVYSELSKHLPGIAIYREYVPSSQEGDNWYISRVQYIVSVGPYSETVVADVMMEVKSWGHEVSYTGFDIVVQTAPTPKYGTRRKHFKQKNDISIPVNFDNISKEFLKICNIVEKRLKRKEEERLELVDFIDRTKSEFGELPDGVFINRPLDRKSDCIFSLNTHTSFDFAKKIIALLKTK